ncbi:radical SAM/SPASM domain-containing protein [Aureibacter tunicatorum]|uniref:Radical SAM protein with 4Fe4S-binding SPASM domain n=1 Tax=Aureibacter tunicatorum TaxID=866807 RepID=A0AAE3XQL0_9BACT|nr:radical SAM protein [Aureibacter tunicatorum]MDR6240830.1 radical SAM protein with 4Fe4S-binding SPASM domain [Aureibacter tunicatorum]BDD06837.1 GDL motif peptide-associated radical SAM/SPASM maturase [Aureibacter tunicatorum]
MTVESNPSIRYRIDSDYEKLTPVHAVWEITLACNLNCGHCGSRAGKVRPDELTTQECFDIIDKLHELGTREITIIGGEAFLRNDWLEIISRIDQAGMECSMQTGGYNLNEKRILDAKQAGIKNIGVSIDGLEDVHNQIRGKRDSYQHALNALELLKKHGITSSVNTVITKSNQHQLDELLDEFIVRGIKNWQIQLIVAMGNAVENDDLILQPYEIIDLYENLIKVYKRALSHNILIQAGNNIGYYGPYEHIWRQGKDAFWTGCSAGHTAIGIEANGIIKGCPSLPTSDYTGGNIKDMTLDDIWYHSKQMKFTRHRNLDELWGHCKSCYYASSCMAGCTWTSHVLFGKRGNNPYCHHRALKLEKEGKRERIRKVQEAEGKPFDYGLFEIIVEDNNGNILEVQNPLENNEDTSAELKTEIRTFENLELCRDCNQHVYEGTEICPHCNSNVPEAKERYETKLKDVYTAYDKLLELMN